MENRPLVKFIRNYIRDSSGAGLFSRSAFPTILEPGAGFILTSEDSDDVISRSYIVVCAKILLSI